MDNATTSTEANQSDVAARERDPVMVSGILAVAFAALAAIRLTVPESFYFDEVHYVPAAREMLQDGVYRNQEHPIFGKQMIALGMVIFGDGALGWRIMSLFAGTLALFASMRALWFASQSRFASIAFGILLTSGFILFVQSRIAMLDIFMVSALAVAAWQFAAAIREPESGRWRLAVTGVALGLAIASKWNAVPLAILPGLAFLVARIAAHRRRLIMSSRGIPVPGISLWEATIWLGVIPLAVYAATFLPVWTMNGSPLAAGGLFAMHVHMLELQTQILKAHPYQSTLADWIVNWRAIWYLYEPVDGTQRGIMLIGNPLTMLLGLPALFWCALSGIRTNNWTKLAVVVGYLASISLWVFAEKSVQFYYHYFAPSCFLLAALSLALDALWQSSRRAIAGGVLLASIAVFAWFYPILSAAPLEDKSSFGTYTWLDSWR
ncbi:phospholipid carrier-dependent glycosyltransferase [Altererythrobacter lutimaris]|uniref:Polyprenol-phosphate-mannose--protein mannosyltransferase n=1 Tax=Altererythrobacter lutimaris TaxID=2743979 RepID=A0A850HBA5_9SPHN|nr:phospholipid carrier-dependent glycosyltransferase [Altererythrobacter lutimaris]NVE94196.1 phospholipid carrier-dependent glycosyltransferase [Altererythrobacter lutimaris]